MCNVRKAGVLFSSLSLLEAVFHQKKIVIDFFLPLVLPRSWSAAMGWGECILLAQKIAQIMAQNRQNYDRRYS